MSAPLPARLQDYLDGVVRRGPETVHVDLSNACNLRCIGCWNYSPLLREPRPAEWKRQMADADRVRALLAEVRALQGERVIFSGSGDPGTHPRLYDLIACAADAGLKVTLISNLTLLDPRRLLDAGARTFLVNVWAATPETYAATHPGQKPEAFAALAEKLRALRSRNVALVFVVCRQNVHEVAAVAEFAASVGARRIQYKLASTGGGTDAIALTAAERAGVLAGAGELRERLERAGVGANLDVFFERLRGAPEESAVPACYAGWYYSRVYVDGRVFLCCKHETEVGDLRRASFREIWLGERYQALRRRLRAGEWLPCCAQCGNLDLNAGVHRARVETRD